jgi:hypothetical protein
MSKKKCFTMIIIGLTLVVSVLAAIYPLTGFAAASHPKEWAQPPQRKGDFGHHTIWTNLVRFIQDLDIEAIKQQAGIAANNLVR